MDSPETRLSLLTRLSDRASEEAWLEFGSLYRPMIYRVARGRGLQHADADDLAQEVLAAVDRAIDSFEHRGSGSFRRWLFQITRNLVVNRLTRDRGPTGSGHSDVQQLLMLKASPCDQTESLFLLEYRRARFRQAAADVKRHFAVETWDAFWSTAVEGESIESVAGRLGKSPGAVRVARCRVIARLREEVARRDDSEFLPAD